MLRRSNAPPDFGASRWWAPPLLPDYWHRPFLLSQLQGDVCYELEGYHVRVVDGYACQSQNQANHCPQGEVYLPHLAGLLAYHLLLRGDPARDFAPRLFSLEIAETIFAHPDHVVTELLRGKRLAVQHLHWYWSDHSAIRYRRTSACSQEGEGGYYEPSSGELERGRKNSFVVGLSCKVRLSGGNITTNQPYFNLRVRLMRLYPIAT